MQLAWRTQRVFFWKGWDVFAKESKLEVDDTVVFTPMDDGFAVQVYMHATSVGIVWGCRRHRAGPWEEAMQARNGRAGA